MGWKQLKCKFETTQFHGGEAGQTNPEGDDNTAP